MKEILQKTDHFYEFNIHSAAQYQRYGLTFNNKGSAEGKDVTFAFKLVGPPSEKTDSVSKEDAALFSYLDTTNGDLAHFMTESKF